MKNIAWILSDTRLFSGIDLKAAYQLCDEIKPRYLMVKKQHIIMTDMNAKGTLYFLKRGRVISERVSPNGEKSLIKYYQKGDFIGLDTAFTTAETGPWRMFTSADAELIEIDGEALMNCAEKKKVVPNLVEMLADEGIRRFCREDIISRKSLREKILCFLGDMEREKTGIKMTQEQMAKYICTTRSSLCSELNSMKKDGLIDFDRGKYKII